ncbi:hypothetical protein [Candidatus Electronema sp. JC]|jgi:hypothetical protein|uniref:hypothetical protein n=1 Tax=Candidatus Electronema sp. JC TaxID=3401570 RepID=UPI003B429AA0
MRLMLLQQRKIFLFFVIFIAVGCAKKYETLQALSDEAWLESSQLPLPQEKSFLSDGCSVWIDSNWLECCVKHDLLYMRGGTAFERKLADVELSECVAQKSSRLMGTLMYYGVRAGGVWWLPTPFRWGFGWDYPQHAPPRTWFEYD